MNTDELNPMNDESYFQNGVFGVNNPTAGFDLDQLLAPIMSGIQSLGPNAQTNPNGINMSQMPNWNIYDPQQCYKNTNGLGNCAVWHYFGQIPLLLPAWHYDTDDDEWGDIVSVDPAGNVSYTSNPYVDPYNDEADSSNSAYDEDAGSGTGEDNPMSSSVGTGILTPEIFQGKTKQHKLYMDLATGNYFYVTRHGHHNPTSGLESDKLKQKYPIAVIPDRDYEDATIGADDQWTKNNDPGYLNTCIVGVPNPHLSKADFMRIVYPSYDDPMQRALALTANPSTFLNESVDDTKYTPFQDLSGVVSAASLSSDEASGISSEASAYSSANTQVLGKDVQPIDPNFHLFRPVNTLAIETHPDMAAADIIGLSGGKYGHLQAWKLIEAYVQNMNNYSCGVGGGLSAQQYYGILTSISPYKNLPDKSDPDYDKYYDPQTGGPVDLVALSIATGKSSFASTPLTKLNSLAPFQQNLAGYMFNRQYRYETLLFDYYADNSKFFSGTIDVTGRLGIEYGIRLLWLDKRRQYVWEFYVDGVSHSWSVNGNGGAPQPWITTISVERGLPYTISEINKKYRDPANGKPYHYTYNVPTIMGTMDHRAGKTIKGNFSKRFQSGFYGRQAIFTGGFFGEQTLASMIAQANLRNRAYMSHFGDSGSSSSTPSKSSSDSDSGSDIISYAKTQIGKHPYAWGSPGLKDATSSGSGLDCAGFTWLCVHHCGYKSPANGWEGDRDLSDWCKKVDRSDTKSGDVITTPGHHMLLEEKWHGDSTRIINEGGDKDNVNESSLETADASESESSREYWEPQKS